MRHAENTSQGIITIGGTLTDAGTWGFTPTHSGFINREPSEVIPDNNIYCYTNGMNQERILVQMLSEDRIMIEYQEKFCTDTIAFEDDFVYYR